MQRRSESNQISGLAPTGTTSGQRTAELAEFARETLKSREWKSQEKEKYRKRRF